MKSEVLKLLKEASPNYVSGEALSRGLKVSRTAVWKYIRELKEGEYRIEASSKKGYRLLAAPEGPNGFEIGYQLGTSVVGRRVEYFDTIGSTNDYAKKIASEGCEDGTVVAAGHQTAGRGRLGRRWESAEGKGIYLSVILKPSIAPVEIQSVTIAAATAAAYAIEAATGRRAGIKWPNDVLVDGKKVCGILTEMNCETDRVNYVICGIGINFSQAPEDFPEELRVRAGSVVSQGDGVSMGRLELIRRLLKELDRAYADVREGRGQAVLQQWKSRSVTLGREISVISREGMRAGRALDITDDGRLVVEFDGGARTEILSGEVSVRGLLGE